MDLSKERKKALKDIIGRLNATSFQKKVWKAILEIPSGQTRSYDWVAKKIGQPRSARAVGNALNKNPLAPEVPCHRVIKKDGSLGGFAHGTKRKMTLLRSEGYRAT